MADPLLDDDGQPTICLHCLQLIRKGEARYVGGESANPPRHQHWDCHERWISGIETDLKTFPAKVCKSAGHNPPAARSTGG